MAALAHASALVLCACSAIVAMPASPAAASDPGTVLFGGLDAGMSRYASIGFKRGIFGTDVDRTGFVVLGTVGGGVYPQRRSGDAGRGHGTVAEAALLVGYQSAAEALTWGAYLGPEINRHWHGPQTFRRDDASRFGLRGLLDLWAQPRPELLVQATLSGGSAERHVYGRLALGLQLLGPAYLGPEMAFYAKPGYGEVKLGLHLSQVPIGPAMLRLSGGWQWSDDARRRSGPYFGLSAYMKM